VSARWRKGWLLRARKVCSPYFGPRPEGVSINLVVLHSISLPPGKYSGQAIEHLFTGHLDHKAHPYFDQHLRGLEVSAHFVIRRDGDLIQFVSCDDRAWHAGASSWQGVSNCNDYSIGIELEGLEGDTFEPEQYRALVRLLRHLKQRYPLQHVVGHEHIAPGRKQDPGPGFDGTKLCADLAWPKQMLTAWQAPKNTL
jgi:N-acetyl-anhydromuramoyl-L-alanine amidase